MKETIEWFNEIDSYFERYFDISACREKLRSTIKQIQLDAYKAGMTEAAEIVLKGTNNAHGDAYWRGQILAARDKKEKI